MKHKQLQYTWIRSLQGNYADVWQVTGDALDFAMSSLGLADETLRARLLALYEHVDAYPDVRETLQRLRSTGRRTAVPSNGTAAMISSATEAAGLSSQIDAILSADEVRIYKPHPAVYELAIARLSLRPVEILFVSSNGWMRSRPAPLGSGSPGATAVASPRSGSPKGRTRRFTALPR